MVGVLAALLEASKSGKGQVVDAAMCDGAASLMSMFFDMAAAGRWIEQRESNFLDGGAHFYGVYECACGRFISIGSIEPQFYALLRQHAGLSEPGFDQQIRIHVTGCTNSCGQSWIADIGLEGKKMKKDGKMVDAFYFCVGGSVGKYAGIARQIGYRAAAEDCPEAIARLLRGYLDLRQPGEDLRSYFARTDNPTLLAQLAGEVVEPVERDPAPVGAGRGVPAE